MKIGINTITNGCNYGNRLQNYALQHVLEENGNTVETFIHKMNDDKEGFNKFIFWMKQVIKRILKRNHKLYYIERCNRFEEFNKKYVHFSASVVFQNNVKQDISKEKFDLIVCGSDQIWNTNFRIIQSDIENYLAAYIENCKIISYAASFGTSFVPEKYVETFKKYLPRFSAISVRENVGIEIVEKLCKKEAVAVLDPTMLLTRQQWTSISHKPKYIKNDKFIVTYFMSGRDEVLTRYIKKVCDKYHAIPINLDVEFISSGKIENKEHYKTAPDEFLWLIEHAQCVLTDSFHATVFSIIFNKPFCVFDRQAEEKENNMASRIDTLLARFSLSEYRDDIDNPKRLPEGYNENMINEILQQERQKSMQFLSHYTKEKDTDKN